MIKGFVTSTNATLAVCPQANMDCQARSIAIRAKWCICVVDIQTNWGKTVVAMPSRLKPLTNNGPKDFWQTRQQWNWLEASLDETQS